ncbi:MAG: D-tyrosyl-tRNA(Tyr) deacylase [Clostridia bacterium]|nr:D-tyrosyl-tRNA(Tyr) deacylase [Clostridia bacterium]
MKAVLQRVSRASVTADGVLAGSAGKGLLILLGVGKEDTEEDALLLANKIAAFRIFSDENGKMNLSLKDIGGQALVVSNFTLYASYSHGNRPDFLQSAPPKEAERLYEHFVSLLRERLDFVATGVFGADMQIDMGADGPVTVMMESSLLKKKKG